MTTAKGFWNWMAARYARQPIADEASYEKKLAMTREHFEPDMRAARSRCAAPRRISRPIPPRSRRSCRHRSRARRP